MSIILQDHLLYLINQLSISFQLLLLFSSQLGQQTFVFRFAPFKEKLSSTIEVI